MSMWWYLVKHREKFTFTSSYILRAIQTNQKGRKLENCHVAAAE